MAKNIVSLKAIAQKAQVSVATVSRILSGTPGRIPEATCQRVMAVAQELDYRPNLLVRGIQRGKSQTIGVMVPPYDTYWSEVLYGIHDALVEADYVPLVLWTQHRPNELTSLDPLSQIYRMIDRRVDGVILWPQFAELYAQHVRQFSSRKVPVVTIDHELPASEQADSVGSDENLGSRIVAGHLLQLGHTQFAHLAGDQTHEWARRRKQAFERTIAEAKGAHLVTEHVAEDASGVAQVTRLLQSRPRPTALFAASDHIALVAMEALTRLRLRVPEDISLLGFGDLEVSARLSPPLTTVRQQPYEIGREAALLILRRARNESAMSKGMRVELPVELVPRQTTGPCPAGKPQPGVRHASTRD